MNFILSKIISRPKSVVLSSSLSSSPTQLSADDHQQMENKINDESSSLLLPVELPQTSLSTSSLSSSSLLLSEEISSSNNNIKNEPSNKGGGSTSSGKKVGSGSDCNNTERGIENKPLLSSSKVIPIFDKNRSIVAESDDNSIENLEKEIDENSLLINKAEDSFKKKEYNSKEIENNLNESKENSKKLTSIPDIINVKPVKDSNSTKNDTLLSSVIDNLNVLNLNSSKELTQSLDFPRFNDGGISSDEEFFSECQSFSDHTQNLQKNVDSNKNWNKVLSNVAIATNNENLQNFNSDLDIHNIRTDPSLNDINYLSSSSSTSLTLKDSEVNYEEQSVDLPIEKTVEKNTPKETLETNDSFSNDENDSNKNMKMNILKNELIENKTSQRNKNELLDSLEKFNYEEISDVNYDSIENSDIFVPQILLRQNKKEFKQKTVGSSEEENIITDSKEIEMQFLQEFNEEIKAVDFIKNNNMHLKNRISPLQNKNSVFSEISHTTNANKTFENIERNLTDDVQPVNISSLVHDFDKSLNNIVENCDEFLIKHNLNPLNETYNELSPSPLGFGKKSVSPVNLTFAPSSEAINSTINLPLERKEVLLEESYNGYTSYNHNETIPIDDLNKTRSLKVDYQDNLSKPNKSQEAVVSSTNSQELEIHDQQFSNESNVSEKSLSNSVEPMDIDTSFEREKCSFIKGQTNTNKNINQCSDNQIINNQFNLSYSIASSAVNNFDFKIPSPMFPPSNKNSNKNDEPKEDFNDDFQNQPGLIFSSTDFDFLLSKGNNLTPLQRNSLLLKFDPLLGHAVPANQIQQQEQQQLQKSTSSTSSPLLTISPKKIYLPSTTEEQDEENFFATAVITSKFVSNENNLPQTSSELELNILIKNDDIKHNNLESTTPIFSENYCRKTNTKTILNNKNSSLLRPILNTKNRNINLSQNSKISDVKMSVDVIQDVTIENDTNSKSVDNLSKQSEEKQDYKMEDLEKKIKNEVLKTEDIEKKLKDAEQREEALLKRITEKDKTISKMSGVIEAYEKALAELIAEKEQIKQNYEKQISELKSDRDSNYQHLLSLESTFSDLHLKYERSKQTAEKLRKSEEDLLNEKRQTTENLRLQEQRYEKMKNHALQQLEIANNKLDLQTKNHLAEVTKLKALLKKEEITRLSIAEQLQQKARENEELMKICDELINGQGS